MSRNPTERGSHARSFARLILAGAAAWPLVGCGIDSAATDTIPPSDYHRTHPIVLAEAPTTLDVYPVGGGVDAQSAAKIRAFAERYRAFGQSRITILAPAGQVHTRALVDQIRRTLASTGLRGTIGLGAYRVADATRDAPVRLVFQGLKAILPTPCGQWPNDVASGSSLEGWKNQSYPDFGCATQAALAAQVDDPRDFAQARVTAAPDVAMRMRAIGDVRNGQDPGTQWKTTITEIGQVGN